jgi:hypothetical protein
MKRKNAEKNEAEGESRAKTPPSESTRKDSLPPSPAPSPAPASALPVTPTQVPAEPPHQTRQLQFNDHPFMLDLAFKQAELSLSRTIDKMNYVCQQK